VASRDNDEADDEQAVGQITSTASMTHNLAQCRTVIQKAVAGGAKVRFATHTYRIGNMPLNAV